MADTNQRPAYPEMGSHEDHPGHGLQGCEHQIQVNASPWGTSRNGYACGLTGGHCTAWRCPLEDDKEVSP